MDDRNIQHEILNQTLAGSAFLQPTGYCSTYSNTYVLHEKLKVGKGQLFIKILGKGLCQGLQDSDDLMQLIVDRLEHDYQTTLRNLQRNEVTAKFVPDRRPKRYGCVQSLP